MEPALGYIQGYPEHIITLVTKMYQDGRSEARLKRASPKRSE
ncbi:hypothetical protein [Vibrio tetraodonis]|nr:hypothetical protein [Vibrio tetraodonis]